MSAKATQLSITPAQATYVLTRLVEAGKLSARDVERVAEGMEREIAELEARLAQLHGALGTGSRSLGRKAPKVRSTSAHQSESRRIQGEYMGLIRHVAGKDRARIKKIAAERGREAAIREMRTLAR